jgi:hypothetical protein
MGLSECNLLMNRFTYCVSQSGVHSKCSPWNEIKKKERFCRRDNIKSVTRFTLQPKWAPEIGQRKCIGVLKNKVKNLGHLRWT